MTSYIAFTQNQREEIRMLGDLAGGLQAESGMHQTNYICECYGLDSYNQSVEKELAPTVRPAIGGDNCPKVFAIGSYGSNAWKSSNPHSGVYPTELAKSLDAANCGYPACQQGGMAIVTEK